VKNQDVNNLRALLDSYKIPVGRLEFQRIVNEVRAILENEQTGPAGCVAVPYLKEDIVTVFRIWAFYDKSINSWQFEKYNSSKVLREAMEEFKISLKNIRGPKAPRSTRFKQEYETDIHMDNPVAEKAKKWQASAIFKEEQKRRMKLRKR
jgi:hypothetical protein